MDQPFADCEPREVRDIGRRIACQYHLRPLALLFELAALLIYNANIFDDDYSEQEHLSLDECLFTEYDQLALRNEPKLGFWDQPWPFRTTCYMLFAAAITQGWNQTATNGANICFLDPLIDSDFGGDGGPRTCLPDTAWKYGLVSAAPFLFSPVGSFLSDPLNELLMGRRRAILVSAVIIFSSTVASAFMERWWSLLICRSILGIGMGGKAAVVPVFLAEIAPTQLRGTIIMNWQVFDALGIFLGFTANLAAASAGPADAWKWQMASSAIPAFAVIMGVTFISWDSPRFLMKHESKSYNHFQHKEVKYKSRKEHHALNKQHRRSPQEDAAQPDTDAQLLSVRDRLKDSLQYRYGPHAAFGYHSKAFETLVILRGNRLLAAKELVYTHCQLIVQKLSAEERVDEEEYEDVNLSLHTSLKWYQWWQRTRGLFTEPYLLRELKAAAAVMTSQPLTGINALIFYSSRLFSAAATNDHQYTISRTSVWLSWCIGLVNFLLALPAYWWIESRGRRFLVLTTLPLLALMMAVTAGSFQIPDNQVLIRRGVIGTWTVLFTAFYSPGLGPVPFTLTAELFPLEYRMVGMSVAVALNLLLGGLLNLVVPTLLDQSNKSILLGCFAVANAIAWVCVYVYVREPEATPPLSGSVSNEIRLEEICEIYQAPRKDYVRFQWNHRRAAFRSVVDFVCGRRTVKKSEDYFVNRNDKVATPANGTRGR